MIIKTLHHTEASLFSRRKFLSSGATVIASAAIHGALRPAQLLAADSAATPALRFGMITDVHYADKPPAGSRHFRDALPKVQTAVSRFNEIAAQDKTGLSFA